MGDLRVYDYVIVGAGSAGCVLAARLGEDPDVKVGVIEAGPPDDEPDDSHAACVSATVAEPLRLGLHERAGARARRAADVSSARACARWLELAERDGLHPWESRGLRRVGGGGHQRLGLRRGAAVLQARRGQRARRELLPRCRRSADGERRPLDASACWCVHRGGVAGRHPRRPTITTARPRKGSAGFSSRSETAGAAARRSRISIRRCSGAMSTS